MNKKAPARCAAGDEISVEGVWGCCPIKRDGTEDQGSVPAFWGTKGIACRSYAELGITKLAKLANLAELLYRSLPYASESRKLY